MRGRRAGRGAWGCWLANQDKPVRPERDNYPGGQARGFVAAERHGLGLGLVELLLAEAGARLVQAVSARMWLRPRRACGHAGPYRSAGGRLVGERDDAARRWGCAEKLQRERLAVAAAGRCPAG